MILYFRFFCNLCFSSFLIIIFFDFSILVARVMETAKEMAREMVMVMVMVMVMERAVERVKERVMAMVKVKEMEMVVVEKVVSADSLHTCTLHNVIWTSRLLPYIDSSSSYTQ